jgi:hypothetical protein
MMKSLRLTNCWHPESAPPHPGPIHRPGVRTGTPEDAACCSTPDGWLPKNLELLIATIRILEREGAGQFHLLIAGVVRCGAKWKLSA